MSVFYLTPASISYLNQSLLAFLITIYLTAHVSRTRRQNPTHGGGFLAAVFASLTLFSLLLFLEASFLPSERLSAVYWQNTALGLLLTALILFAYAYPELQPGDKTERRWVLGSVSLYTLLEAGLAFWRFSLLRQGQVEFRPDYLDYAPILGFAGVIFIFARKTWRHWQLVSIRHFAIIFLLPCYLAALNLLRSFNLVSAPFYHINLSVGVLLTMFLFALNYLNAQSEMTSFITKFSGAILTSVLAILGVIAWVITPAYTERYTFSALDRRTFRYTPNQQGGYDLSQAPFHFETELGQNLGLTDNNTLQPAFQIHDFPFVFFGQPQASLSIVNDGLIVFGAPIKLKDLEYRFSTVPVILALLVDLDPEANAAGGIYLRRETDRLVITFDRVAAYYWPANLYTFQVILRRDNSFEITYNGLPDLHYQLGDRADATLWAIGLKPAGSIQPAQVNLMGLPVSSGPAGALHDEYRLFRQELHLFLVPLAVTILVCGLFFMLAMPLLLHFTFARPLDALLEGVQALNSGQRETLIPVISNDEVGYLTASFNQMGAQIESLIKNLEIRVAERTTDLLTVNEQLRKLSIAVEQSPSSIVITDLQARIEYVNPAFTQSTGYSLEEVLGQNPRFLKTEQTPPETYLQMWQTLLRGETWRGELCNRKKNGLLFWEYTVIAPIYAETGLVTHYVAVKEDITERRRVEETLYNEGRRWQTLFEHNAAGIFIIAPDYIIRQVNGQCCAILGFPRAELLGLNTLALFPDPSQAERWRQQNQIAETIPGTVTVEHPLQKKDGSLVWCTLSGTCINLPDGETGLLWNLLDISERVDAERELERLAMTDPLTELFNRRHFFIEAENFFTRSDHPPFDMVAMMLDIDLFKQVNDTYGHNVGDIVLREVARRLKENLRPTDLLGRYGGEEFVALLPRTSLNAACQIAERLLRAIDSKPMAINFVDVSLTIPITISIGLAPLSSQVHNLDELLSLADRALYIAKNTGRDRWALPSELQGILP